jgi:hypothetical protein
VTGDQRRLHNVELHDLYAAPNIISMIKSRTMRLTGHVAHVAKMRRTVFWFENLKGRDNSEDLGIDGRILEWILGK